MTIANDTATLKTTVPKLNRETRFSQLPERLRFYLLSVFKRLGVVQWHSQPNCICIDAARTKIWGIVAALRPLGFYCPGTSMSAGYRVNAETGVIDNSQAGETVYTVQLYFEFDQDGRLPS